MVSILFPDFLGSYTLFPSLLNMSLTASVVIVFVLLARLALRKAPKIFSYVLWSVVLFRLLCPVTVSTPVSLLGLFDTPVVETSSVTTAMGYIPSNIVHTEFPAVDTPVEAVNEVVNARLPQGEEQLVADPLEVPATFGTLAWWLGLLVMAAWAVYSYSRVRWKLLGAVRLWENIWLSEQISSPFVMGLFRPKIYLPHGLQPQEQDYIIAHERHHIRRLDHVAKALAFLALCIHWFNPLVWVAFVLASRDMEMSCDEAVVRRLGSDIRADYSASLLRLATGRRILAGAPLAFGEGDTKSRIKNLANWKKPAFWVVLTAVLTCVVLIICLLTNPQRVDGQIMVDGTVFKQVDFEDGELPAGSREIGRILEIVTTPESDYQASGLPKRYAGLPVFQTEAEPFEIYVPTSDGFLCFRSDEIPASAGVRRWVDYLEAPQEMPHSSEALEATLLEIPGVTFRYTPGEVTAENENGHTILIRGMPIWNVYFADLNGDGCPEICATVSFGSGMIDNHVVVVDYAAGEEYTLWERGERDYVLRLEDGILVCDKRQYPNGEMVQSGPLTMVAASYTPWILTTADPAAMVPTVANLSGVFDGYLYLEREDGLTYRYERAELYGETLTKGELLDMFTEKAVPNDVQWQVYAIEEIPDRTSVLAIADGVLQFRYNYSPSKGVSSSLLQQAKAESYVVMEDGEATHGQDLWQEFYAATQRGEPATVKIARWYTLDPATCDATYYEAFKEDYPCIYYDEVHFDGSVYQLIKQEDNRSFIPTYQYLMRYETEAPMQYSHEEPQTVIRYVLTHDDTHTWDELFYSLVSSAMDAYIDHYSVYTER